MHPLPGPAMDELDVNLMRGTLDLLILKALSWGPRHGYAVAEWIREATGSMLQIGEGTLYPALHRLERLGHVAADWGLSENNRTAKFYALTRKGRRTAQAELDSWLRLSGAVTRVLRGLEQGA